jgi:hypothetical protein
MAGAARGGRGRTLMVTALLSAIAALALINWHLYTTTVEISPLTLEAVGQEGRQAKDLDLTTPLDDKPLIMFEETVERPLFHADRKPIERTEVAQAPPAPALQTGMQLVGIVKSADAPARALIRFAGEPIGTWVPEGESVNGWQLTTVKTFSVVLHSNGQTHELKLPSLPPPNDAEGNERGGQPPRGKTR